MKFKSMALLLSFVICSMLLLFPLSPVSTTSARQDRIMGHSVDSSNNGVGGPAGGSLCGRPFADGKVKSKLEEELESIWQNGVQAYNLGAGSVTIKVYFHVIMGSGGTGYVAEDVLDRQIEILNASFGGATGGAYTPFRFEKACVTRTTNQDWFEMPSPMAGHSLQEIAAKRALRRGGATDLNFYTISNSDSRGERSAWTAQLPCDYANDPILDGIVVPHTMLPGGSRSGFSEGDIAVHEVGHWLGLYHTYEGIESGPEPNKCIIPTQSAANCKDPSDDLVDDTPPHRQPPSLVGTCPTAPGDTCTNAPGLDPYDNFMTDMSDACKRKFTDGQAARMVSEYTKYRSTAAPPTGTPPTASVAWIAPAENTWGPPNTMTAAGYAQQGFGNVQLVWRDTTIGGPWNVVDFQAIPGPDNTWSNTIASPYKCHNFEAYVNYSCVKSEVLTYKGLESGYCDESVNLIWVQPAQSGTSGDLRVAGKALNAPPGTLVYVWYRNVTAGTPKVRHYQGAGTLPDGIWMIDIPNANFYHMYEVEAEYDVLYSKPPCTYWGNNSISWCQ